MHIFPRVSVILPTFNRAHLLARSVESVLGQTFRDFEVIVVDDGSTDDTAEVVGRFLDRRVSSIRLDRNLGAAAARNVGLRHAAGELLVFQDSDDEWLPDKLEKHVRMFDECPFRVGVVYSDMLRVLPDGSTRYHRSPEIVPDRLINPETGLYQVRKLGIQACVMRRECFDLVGAFDETLPSLEDLELFIRLACRVPFIHIQEPLVRYHKTPGLSSDAAANRRSRLRLLELYEQRLAAEDEAFVAVERSLLR